jgi:glutamine amidotransferase
MSNYDVAIVDLGIGNLLSVERALYHLGIKALTSRDPDLIVKQKRIILPGVGSFSEGMSSLKNNNLDKALIDIITKGIPLFGICLGMQMLFDSSEEFEITNGLGFIEGNVEKIPNISTSKQPLKIPHIGWSNIKKTENAKSNKLFGGINKNSFFYFVHSYVAKPKKEIYITANCIYGGHSLTAIVSKDNITGCQFHPEKSGQAGLALLKSFCEN